MTSSTGRHPRRDVTREGSPGVDVRLNDAPPAVEGEGSDFSPRVDRVVYRLPQGMDADLIGVRVQRPLHPFDVFHRGDGAPRIFTASNALA